MNEQTPFQFSGAIAFITGGASGIGLAIARSLVREGARVALADLNSEWLRQAVEGLGEAAIGIPLDVVDRIGWHAARTHVERELGEVDILVNNAGIGPDFTALDEMSPEHFDRVVEIKLTGTYNGIHEFVPGLRARGRGHVVNTASMAGLTSGARLGAYTAAMFGVVGLSEVLAAELAPAGVGVSVLCPGRINTRIAESSELAGVHMSSAIGTAITAASPEPMAPEIVGDLVVEAIRHNHLHVVTHAKRRGEVERRIAPVLEAFSRAP